MASTKRAREEEVAALDLSLPPKKIAEQLLNCLGGDAPAKSTEAKNLELAMRHVRKELEARSTRQGRAAEQLGSQSALAMGGAALPSDVFEHIAGYIAPKNSPSSWPRRSPSSPRSRCSCWPSATTTPSRKPSTSRRNAPKLPQGGSRRRAPDHSRSAASWWYGTAWWRSGGARRSNFAQMTILGTVDHRELERATGPLFATPVKPKSC